MTHGNNCECRGFAGVAIGACGRLGGRIRRGRVRRRRDVRRARTEWFSNKEEENGKRRVGRNAGRGDPGARAGRRVHEDRPDGAPERPDVPHFDAPHRPRRRDALPGGDGGRRTGAREEPRRERCGGGPGGDHCPEGRARPPPHDRVGRPPRARDAQGARDGDAQRRDGPRREGAAARPREERRRRSPRSIPPRSCA